MEWSFVVSCFIFVGYAYQISVAPVVAESPKPIINVFTNRCIEDLGCFYTGPPFYDSVHRPSSREPTDKLNVKFYLFTPDNPTELYELSPTEKSLSNSSFNAEKETKIVIHGYLVKQNLKSIRSKIKDALLKEGGYNVILVDWTAHNSPPYDQAVANTRVIGALVAKLVKILMKSKGISPQSIHIEGNSLGAHMAGYVGERIPNMGRITGLDPAGPFFENTDPIVRLDPTDALFVDVIHTNAPEAGNMITNFGITQPIGHMDFYPNGGKRQPGCTYIPSTELPGRSMINQWLLNSCNHVRSEEYFLESIQSKSCRFLSVRCSSYKNFKKGNCPANNATIAEMGFRSTLLPGITPPAKYFLTTKGSSPFCTNL